MYVSFPDRTVESDYLVQRVVRAGGVILGNAFSVYYVLAPKMHTLVCI